MDNMNDMGCSSQKVGVNFKMYFFCFVLFFNLYFQHVGNWGVGQKGMFQS